MLTREDIDWIESHKNDDVASLRLRSGSSDSSALHRILQIECRRKASSKLPDTLKYDKFEFPSALLAEQCTSDRLAAYHALVAGPQKSVADLTAGLGIDVFHLAGISEKVIAFEINAEAAAILTDNASALGYSNIEVVCADCAQALPRLADDYTLLFIDPARRGTSGERVYSISSCQPDIIPLLPEFARHSPRMLVKLSPMLDMSAVERELAPYVSSIYAIGTRTECKEILVDLMFRDSAVSTPLRKAVTLCPDGKEYSLVFTKEEESSASAGFSIGSPQPGQWLIEPWPAIMKAAPWNILCTKFGLKALASNSHLYLASSQIVEVGSCFHILEVLPYSSGNIKRLHRKYPAAGITTRNFPVNPQAMRAKLGLKDSDDIRIFATTLEAGEKVMIMAEPVA